MSVYIVRLGFVLILGPFSTLHFNRRCERERRICHITKSQKMFLNRAIFIYQNVFIYENYYLIMESFQSKKELSKELFIFLLLYKQFIVHKLKICWIIFEKNRKWNFLRKSTEWTNELERRRETASVVGFWGSITFLSSFLA